MNTEQTDLEVLLLAEEALDRGDRREAPSLLTDLHVFDEGVCGAMAAAFDGDLTRAAVLCRRARDARTGLSAAA